MSCRSSRKYINTINPTRCCCRQPPRVRHGKRWAHPCAPIGRSLMSSVFTPLNKSGNAADETTTQILGLFQTKSSTTTSTIHSKRAFVAYADFNVDIRTRDTYCSAGTLFAVCIPTTFPMAEYLCESSMLMDVYPWRKKRICSLMLQV